MKTERRKSYDRERRGWAALLAAGAIIALFTACAGPKPADDPDRPASAPPEKAVKVQETYLMDIPVPEGWEIGPLTEGYPDKSPFAMLNMQRKGREEYVLFAVQKNNVESPEEHVTRQIVGNPSLKATPAEAVTLGDVPYVKTTYTYGGCYQEIFVARFDNLHQVKITCQGKDVVTDPDVKAILGNLKFKFEKLPPPPR